IAPQYYDLSGFPPCEGKRILEKIALKNAINLEEQESKKRKKEKSEKRDKKEKKDKIEKRDKNDNK
ncbi:hypothetical protein GGI03_003725, partial [Coemansia sp. RSA 2337]